jgi:hypothetical protein
MPNLSGMAALDVLIGLFFLYAVLSIVCSAINELVATAFNLRAGTLERGIRNLLDDKEHARDFYGHWRIRALFKPKKLNTWERKPSYLPSRVFALTVLDTFAPPAEGVQNHDVLKRARDALEHARSGTTPEGQPRFNRTVTGLFQDALDEAYGVAGDARTRADQFRAAIERSFDEVMDRASGWYKRRVQYFLIGIAALVAIVLNVDSFAIAQRLWKDDALRAAVVAQANVRVAQGTFTSCGKRGAQDSTPTQTTQTTTTPAGTTPTETTQSTPAEKAAACVDEVEELGLPLGWASDTKPKPWRWAYWNSRTGLAKLLGLLVTVFALSFGAPFWFGLLGKIVQIRGSGPPPTAPEKAAQK